MDRNIVELRTKNHPLPLVVVRDVRDLFYGEYAVEQLQGGYGYSMVYSSTDLGRCKQHANALFEKLTTDKEYLISI